MRCIPFPAAAGAARLLRASRQALLALLALVVGGLASAAGAQPRDYFYFL
ncbi:MAG: hypothetical protein IT500_14570, partial [Rubrivivax sp.]|nr:hypothetical protein [Rubrivivax sp.]